MCYSRQPPQFSVIIITLLHSLLRGKISFRSVLYLETFVPAIKSLCKINVLMRFLYLVTTSDAIEQIKSLQRKFAKRQCGGLANIRYESSLAALQRVGVVKSTAISVLILLRCIKILFNMVEGRSFFNVILTSPCSLYNTRGHCSKLVFNCLHVDM